MQNDTNPETPNPSNSQPSLDTSSQPVSQPTNNKKLLVIIGSVLGVLLVALIVLVIMLIAKNDDNNSANNSQQDQAAQQDNDDTDGPATQPEREVVLRKATSNDKLELIIYKPEQNASNTTLYFGVENVCEGCEGSTSVYQATSGFNNKIYSYLIDDNNGKKYSAITDQDDRVLASASCGGSISYGEVKECFVAFSKVPSGSTVSWVYGDNRVDGIKVE